MFIIENENQPGECQRDPDHGFGLTLGYVFGHRKMKKAAVLDPNAPKNSSYGHLLLYFNHKLFII